MVEEWKALDHDNRYQVSNLGRVRKKLKKGYRYLKPFRKRNMYVVKMNYETFNLGRLVAHYFIRPLTKEDKVYHKNKLEFDNFYRNLKIMSASEVGKRTGHIGRSRAVVEIKNNEIVRRWRSSREAEKTLFINHQTICDYCNNKVKKPMLNLMWEDDYFNKVLEKFSWEIKRK